MCTCGVSACRRGSPPEAERAAQPPAPSAPVSEAAIGASPRLVGRFAVPAAGGPARFAWSGSTIELRVRRARSVAVRLRAAPLEPHSVVTDGKTVWIDERTTPYSVFLDDKPAPGIDVASGEGRYVVARELDPAVEHVVRVVREAEAFAGVHELVGVELPGGGELLAPEPRRMRLELVGDSIMCGYGVLGADATCPFTFATERASAAYPALAARALGADASTLCWSGRGVHRNYDGSTMETMPELYERTLPLGARDAYPFDREPPPAAVVIGLGTNDFLGGGDEPLDVAAFEESYVRFLARLRALRPRAPLVVVTSPMLGPEPARTTAGHAASVRDVARRALERVVAKRRAAGDARVVLVDLPYQGTRVGCDRHPNAEMHRELADVLVRALRTELRAP